MIAALLALAQRIRDWLDPDDLQDVALADELDEIVPLPSNPTLKFFPQQPCRVGEPVLDTSNLLTTGEPVCSLCRGRIALAGDTWVHARRQVPTP